MKMSHPQAQASSERNGLRAGRNGFRRRNAHRTGTWKPNSRTCHPSSKSSNSADAEWLFDSAIMAAMKKSTLLLIVSWALPAPASAAFVGGNSRLGAELLDAGSRHVGGEVSRAGLPDSGEAWLEGTAEFFVAPSAPRGGANPAVQKAASRGSTLHSDKPGHLPDQLRQRYPDTQFEFTKRGQVGQDVRVVGGKYPSEYPGSNWPKGVDCADFKPNTQGGNRTFQSDQRNKWPDPTHMLPYDPQSGQL